MIGLFNFLRVRRDVICNISVALCGGSYVGGVMFNVLGAGSNTQNAFVGLALMVFFLIFALIAKGGK